MDKLKSLKVTDCEGIRTIMLNRPNSLNSINYDVLNELEEIIKECEENDQVRVVVLKGSGRAFCAGDDLKGMGTKKIPFPEDNLMKRSKLMYTRFILGLRHLSKPVIGQIHGYALGAGCDLALSCDLVFATEDTKFGFVFAKRGLTGGMVLLPKIVGYHKACELLFTGDMFSASQAKALGLVNEITTKDNIEELVNSYAKRLSKAPTMAIGMMKNALNQSLELEKNIEIQKYVSQSIYYTMDRKEGGEAFKEKREPRFIGK